MTAVEKLEISLLGIISFDSEEKRAKYKERIAKAKEMEKEQRGYTEEEVSDLLKCLRIELNINKELIDIDEWFEQFKKK